jgi:pimeloyl-ACP methyl ester carboxylesterase
MSHTIAGITMPDSHMARDLTQQIRDTEADLLFHHSTRVYLFGALTGQRKGLTYDAKLIWQLASPQWPFDEATFERSAAAFDNPDHVSIVIHNYRWRLGLAEGEPQYDDLEKRLAEAPVITVPTITLEGDANGAPHPDASAYAKQFSGPYVHRVITGGIGHNLPQEAPQAFAEAVLEVDGY